MTYTLRPYQEEAVAAAVAFFTDDTRKHNAILVAATGAGKSLILAFIAKRLDANILVFQPNREILSQNYDKAKSLGLNCSMYSASVGEKIISPLTFATIGSVKNCPELFTDFDYICVDECQYVSSKQGMYKDFFKQVNKKVLGLTATPYRLESHPNMNWKTKKIKGKGTSELKMMTKYRGAIFKEIIYNIETGFLVNQGFLSHINYYDLTPADYNTDVIKKNSSGADFDEKSLALFQERFNTEGTLLNIIYRVLHPKLEFDRRNGVLVFVRGVDEAKRLASLSDQYAYVSGDMPKKEREAAIKAFKEGEIRVLFNSAILICGFDYPALDCVILATPTMSLARYSQETGRCIRISKDKSSSWLIDLCGNYKRFGRTDNLYLKDGEIWSAQYNKQLTGVTL